MPTYFHHDVPPPPPPPTQVTARPDEHPVAADLFDQSRAAERQEARGPPTYDHQDVPPATARYSTRSITSGAEPLQYMEGGSDADTGCDDPDWQPAGSGGEPTEYDDGDVVDDEGWEEQRTKESKEGAIPMGNAGKELAGPPVFPPGRVLEDITPPDAVEGGALAPEEKLAAVGSHMTPGLLKAHEAWLEKVAAKLDVTKIEQSLTSVKRVLPASNNATWSRGDVVERCKALLNLRGEVIERVGSEEGGKAIADNTSYGFVFIRNDDYTTRYLSLPAFIAEFGKEDSKDVYVWRFFFFVFLIFFWLVCIFKVTTARAQFRSSCTSKIVLAQ